MEGRRSDLSHPSNVGEWAASHWGHLDSPGLMLGPGPAPLCIAFAAMTLCVGMGPPCSKCNGQLGGSWGLVWVLRPWEHWCATSGPPAAYRTQQK